MLQMANVERMEKKKNDGVEGVMEKKYKEEVEELKKELDGKKEMMLKMSKEIEERNELERRLSEELNSLKVEKNQETPSNRSNTIFENLVDKNSNSNNNNVNNNNRNSNNFNNNTSKELERVRGELARRDKLISCLEGDVIDLKTQVKRKQAGEEAVEKQVVAKVAEEKLSWQKEMEQKEESFRQVGRIFTQFSIFFLISHPPSKLHLPIHFTLQPFLHSSHSFTHQH